MEIQYHSHIKDRNGVTFIAIINPVNLNPNIPHYFLREAEKDE